MPHAIPLNQDGKPTYIFQLLRFDFRGGSLGIGEGWGVVMLAATGNINTPYEVLGVVHAVVTRAQKSGGCRGGGGLPVQEAYEATTKALYDAAVASGGNAVIHIGYDYRMSSAKLGCNDTQPVFEVYGWGTAIRTIA